MFEAIAVRQSWKWLEDTDSSIYTSDVKTLNAHFDGKNIVLDEPAKLKPSTKVRVVVPENGETDAELVESCARLSEPAFDKIWGNPLDAGYDKL